MSISEKLEGIENTIKDGLNLNGVREILKTLGASEFPLDILEESGIYSDCLPRVKELPFTKEKRYLHFLWDALDKLPICTMVDFTIPFRRIIAKKLFKRCGKNLIVEENVRFNFGQNIEVGDNVLINRGVYLDSKGGISIGDSVGFAENVVIFSHIHKEENAAERTYAKVNINSYSTIAAQAIILPGVTVGECSFVAANSVVSKDVPNQSLVAGTPAKLIRETKVSKIDKIWLLGAKFQDE